MVRVLIVAGIRLYREGLAHLLGKDAGFEVLAAIPDCSDTIQGLTGLEPDVVLLDLATPESLGIIQELKRLQPQVPIVALGVPHLAEDLLRWMEAGVSGYIERDGSLEDLVAAVQSAGRGELQCSPRVAGQLLRRMTDLSLAQPREPERLTQRELQVVQLLQQSLSNKDIARALRIEVATVKNHVHNLFEKLGIRRRSELIRRRYA